MFLQKLKNFGIKFYLLFILQDKKKNAIFLFFLICISYKKKYLLPAIKDLFQQKIIIFPVSNIS